MEFTLKNPMRQHSKLPTNEDGTPKSIWDDAYFYNKWTYRVVNPFLELGISKTLQQEDLLVLSDRDRVKELLPTLLDEYKKAKPTIFFPRLLVAMIRAHWYMCVVIVLYTLLEVACIVMLPVILFRFLKTLANPDSTGRENYQWAAILGGLGIVQTVSHHILFFYSMRLGWNWRSSVTGLIYDRLFKLNSNMKSTFTTGKLVNLISNDVARFEEFSIFGSFSWIGILVILAILLILVNQLNVSAGFAGVGVTLLFIPMQVKLANFFAKIRGQTARATDQRVRYISEVIDGIASVKSYGWEKPFYTLIGKYRDEEASCIKSSQRLRAVNQGLYYCSSPVAAFVTFLVYWLTGNTLTLPIVFSTMALLQTLRTMIGRMWTRSIETGSEAFASCYRIESFLSMVDDELTKGVAAKTEADRFSVKADDQSTESVLVSLNKTSFSYGDDESKPTIKNLEFSVHKGELLIIVGAVGAGMLLD